MTDWRSLAAWSLCTYVGHWLAMALFYLRPDSPSIQLSPFGPRGFGGDPVYGLAAAALLGFIPRFGHLLWIGAGVGAVELTLFRRSLSLDAAFVFGLALVLAGFWRSGKGWAALAMSVLLPLAFIRAVSIPWQFGWRSVAALSICGAMIAIAVLRKRERWSIPPLPLANAAIAAVLVAGGSVGGAAWLKNLRDEQHAAALASIPKPTHNAPYEKDYFHKGVSFTAEGGASYEHPASIEMLRKLPEFGVQSIALIPYGFSAREGISIRFPPKRGGLESEDGIEILAGEAHRLGMRVLLKPHVWRLQGRPAMARAEAVERLKEYGPFIVHYAKFAERIHADAFCIGTELAALTQHESEWRAIIADVRTVYRGPVTYAASHGEEFETILFWDALDFIGLDAYYPLDEDYRATQLLSAVERVRSRFAKPIVFTEAGFAAHQDAHKAPWEDETSKPLDLPGQARAYEALLAAVKGMPWFRGVYWWKVGTNGYGGPNNNSMTPWRKPAMEVVRRFYKP